MISRYKWKNFNLRLVIFVILLSAIGVLLVGSADSSLQLKQMIGVIFGIILMMFLSMIDYSWILNLSWIIYAINLAMLILVLVTGSEKKGASRWIQIGGASGFQFQPTELSKLLLILFFALYFMKHENVLNEWKSIFKVFLLVLPPLLLILMQPDLKNTITITLVLFFVFFAAGLSYKKIGIMLAVIIPVGLILLLLITKTDLPIIQKYQRDRIMTFLEGDNEEYSQSAIQQKNSITAIGSGQLSGKGLNNNKVTSSNRGNFVAELQNDFIFAVAGEELGFIGCGIIILLILFIVLECLRTGSRAKDLSGTLVCCGVASQIAVQSFINISVATGIFPNTGTPLPFVSYGLTSIFCLYMSMGIVLNIGLQPSLLHGASFSISEKKVNL